MADTDQNTVEAQFEVRSPDDCKVIAAQVFPFISSKSGACSQRHFNGGGPDVISGVAVSEQGDITFWLADPEGLERRREHQVTICADLIKALYCAFHGSTVHSIEKLRRDLNQYIYWHHQNKKEIAQLTTERDAARGDLAAIRKISTPPES